ncbi:thioredoxin family protein [Hugenholtzia roseola]|uniref:thioredoxin family protein n=1 Tax=Hugenholtzia roseola TaxID=1002 RepID=UPI0004042E38|nr:thioredoxin family protein [Hugenholtzia roseola]
MVEILTDNEGKTQLAAQEKAIVKYFASWCGSCRLIKPKYNRLSEDERFKGIAFLDVDAENSPELRQLAGVTNLPYFAIFEKGVLKEGIATNKEEAIVELLGKL